MGDAVSAEQLDRDASAADAPPLPEGFEFVSAGETPSAAMAAIAASGLDKPDDDIPLIDDLTEDEWLMPGGAVIDGQVHRKARVRELNGEDEEFLARALAANDFARWTQVLLERGVTHIGPHPTTPEMLDALIVGDRDSLVLGVRIATYGPTMDLDVVCQHCGTESKIRIDFKTEVPVRPLRFPIEQPEQSVPLRSSIATVRLATGGDMRFLAGLENKTIAEINTELMTRCVIEINGDRAISKSVIRGLGMADRGRIIDWMADSQPGPEYDKVKHACTICGKETDLGLTAGDMFRG